MTAGLPDTHFQNDLLLGTSFTTVSADFRAE